jgi:tetratricopeptide (TPR) repeat protein
MKDNKKAAKNTPPAHTAPKGKRLIFFKILAFLIPVIFLVLLELLLRICNYGDNTDLFVKYPPDEKYMVMNYYASDKFFPDTASATKGNQEIFAINKAPNTVRIFVLGESTTLGFPFRPNGSFHRWLQYRLSSMYPGKNFEIINLSLTAVNSYTVLDFGKQLAPYHPDAVLIYTGHNEYYGALGVGSTTAVGNNRFLLQTLVKLRTLKTVQLINNTIHSIAGLFASKKPGDQKSLMETMAARQHIAYGSGDYKAGIKQFDENMTELCRTLNDEHIPTFLSTVVSNEKDQPPFISNGDGPGSANAYYFAGQQAFKDSSFAAAKQDFDKAKEFDQLRFRAPEAINTVIKKIASEFPYIHLVDTKQLFEQYAPHGIVDRELIMEHVHPTLLGYAIMSEAFYRAIQQQQVIKDKPETELSFVQLRHEMPITKLDSAMGQYQIMMLKTQWPFNQPIDKNFKVGSSVDENMAVKVALGHMLWATALGQVFAYDKKTGDIPGQLKIAEAMVLQYPQTPDFYGYSGNLNAKLGNYAQAAFYYRKLYMLNNDATLPQIIFKLYLEADDPANALKYVANSASPKALTAVLNEIINDESQLKTNPGNKTLTQQIAADYNKLGLDKVKLNNGK